jgi:small conductance mechanosensitive channel
MSRIGIIGAGLAWGLVLAAGAGVGAAQTTAEQTVDSAALREVDAEVVGARAASVLGELAGITENYRRHRDRLAAASSEDSLVLRLQMNRGVDDFMTALETLADLVQAGGADDPSRQDLRARATDLYTAVTPEIWALAAALRGEIDALRAARTWTTPDARLALENRITGAVARLDRLLVYTGRHVQVLAALDLDAEPVRREYETILTSRADALSGRLALAVARAGELADENKERPGDAELGLLLAANRRSLDALTSSFGTTLDAMRAQGLETEAYRAQLLDVTQDLAAGLLDARLTVTLLRRAWDSTVRWLVERGPGWLVKTLFVVLILLAGRLLAMLVRKAVDKSLRRARLDISQLLQRTIVSTAHNAMMAVAVMVALAQLGINLGPLLAGLGVVGFILGFAMQDSLSNFASGLMILFYRPYDVGDLVDISGVFGKVEHMSLVSTSILTLDNQKLVVPNSRIWGDVIKNVTDQKVRRVDMTFGISYSDDIPKAETVLEQILAESSMVLADPAPMVRLHTLNESSVDFVVRPWVKTADYWDVYWEVTRAVKMRFDAEGISIPFPQRDVHLYQVAPGEGAERVAGEARPLPRTGARDDDPEAEEEDG